MARQQVEGMPEPVAWPLITDYAERSRLMAEATRYSIAKRIAFVRRERRLSQQEVAARCGIPPRSFQRYEYGQSSVPAEILSRMAVALECDVDFFLGLTSVTFSHGMNGEELLTSFGLTEADAGDGNSAQAELAEQGHLGCSDDAQMMLNDAQARGQAPGLRLSGGR